MSELKKNTIYSRDCAHCHESNRYKFKTGELVSGKVIFPNSTRHYLDGQLHRDDGPAVEFIDGSYKAYYQFGLKHNSSGPAVITIYAALGTKNYYFLENIDYPFEEWLEKVWDSLSLKQKKGYIYDGFQQ